MAAESEEKQPTGGDGGVKIAQLKSKKSKRMQESLTDNKCQRGKKTTKKRNADFRWEEPPTLVTSDVRRRRRGLAKLQLCRVDKAKLFFSLLCRVECLCVCFVCVFLCVFYLF